jgi:4-hydroxyphenylacetate 3-monooxygenase
MAIRSGSQYLDGLKDNREIWFEGERVRDVVAHPILGRAAATIASLYDLQCDPNLSDELTYRSPTTADAVSMAFIQPRSPDDLVRRRRMFKRYADAGHGMLGRTPDFLNTILAAFACCSPYFGRNGAEFAERIVAYYEFCRERDLCATHALVDPQNNRARTQSQQADPDVPLHVVGESSQGLVVSGARMLATLAPYADEVLIYPSPSRTDPSDAARFAFAFAAPLTTPGLKFICRESFDIGRSPIDHPLSSRYEEMDAIVIFEKAVIPWERVFLKGDIGLCNRLFRETPILMHGIHHFTTKNLAKAEFVLGVASLIAEAIGRTELPAYQQLLGEIVDSIMTLRSFIRAAEIDAVHDELGYYHPNPDIMSTARNYFPRVYPRLIEILQLIGSSGLMATPLERDLNQPELASDIERYYQGATVGGRDRVRLFRLAWDLACSSFAGRQVLYERFFAGDVNALLQARFRAYDRSEITRRVQSLLDRPAGGD